MEKPELDIVPIIHSLTQDPPSLQKATLERYFTNNAAFTHPFCRTGSFDNSRWLILAIYRWYKIISPRIEISVDSVAFDEKNLILYVGMRQNFKLWFIPFYLAHVSLVTVLRLTTDPDVQGNSSDGSATQQQQQSKNAAQRYWIQSQNDLYQTNEWIKFIVPWGIGSTLVVAWQFFATFMSVLGAVFLSPFTALLEHAFGGNSERVMSKKLLGPS